MKAAKYWWLVFILLLIVDISFGQCSMCQKGAQDGGKAGGLNTGILYLMSVPYILFGCVAFFWYKHSKSETAKKEQFFTFIRNKLRK